MNDDEELTLNEATTALSRLAGALAESLAPFVQAMLRAPGVNDRGVADRAKLSVEAGVGQLWT
jgi:hypothetical protein